MTPYVKTKEIRVEKKLSQIQLAKKARISQSYLSELESNKKSPTLRQLCKIADALGVMPGELVFYIDYECKFYFCIYIYSFQVCPHFKHLTFPFFILLDDNPPRTEPAAAPNPPVNIAPIPPPTIVLPILNLFLFSM